MTSAERRAWRRLVFPKAEDISPCAPKDCSHKWINLFRGGRCVACGEYVGLRWSERLDPAAWTAIRAKTLPSADK